MTKFLTLLAAVALTASLTANGETAQRTVLMANPQGKTAKVVNAKRYHAPKREGAITDQPEGTVRMMTRNATVYTNLWDEVTNENVSGIITEMVNGTDGFLYWQSPVNSFITSTYAKGKEENGVMTFEFPQNMGEFEEYDYWEDEMVTKTYFTTMLEPNGDDWVNIANNQKLTLTKTGETYVQDGSSILGIMTNSADNPKSWSGNGENNIRLEEMTDKPVVLPAEAKVQKWALYYENGIDGTQAQQFINVAVVDDKVYIGGLYTNLPEAWVMGFVTTDGKVRIPSGQYLGADLQEGRYVFAIGATYTTNSETQEVTLKPQNEIFLPFDPETYEIKADPTVALMMGTTYNANTANMLKLILSPNARYEGPITPAMPADPVIVGAKKYTEEDGEGYLRFYIYPKSNEDKLLDTDFITYNIFINNELFSLSPDRYAIDETMTEIPYNFQDANQMDIQAYNDGYHAFYYYVTGVNTIGVKVNYTVDGVTNSTDVIYYDFNQEGVEDITSTSTKTRQYFDLMGRQINKPSNGLYILRTIDAQGNVSCQKRMAR